MEPPFRNLGNLSASGRNLRFATGGAHQVPASALYGLRITNLDTANPPGYRSGDYPRRTGFNRNVLQITDEPRMPRIDVSCEISGFEIGDFPIQWRLQCRQVLCRHTNHGQYRYGGATEIFDMEWQGVSRAEAFALFDDMSLENVECIYNSMDPGSPVLGGHAILSVSVNPARMSPPLLDFVHLRIGGTNPGSVPVLQYVEETMVDRDRNIRQMVRAVFAHEAAFNQFRTGTQTQTNMNFRQAHHQNDPTQPDCRVAFNWPDDPAHFPLATFDFGVGISQYTKVGGRTIPPEIAWDWTANVDIGINLLLANLRQTHTPGISWRDWAREAWRRYNGSGPQAVQYAADLLNSAEGSQVDPGMVPIPLVIQTETRALAARDALDAPPEWPPAV